MRDRDSSDQRADVLQLLRELDATRAHLREASERLERVDLTGDALMEASRCLQNIRATADRIEATVWSGVGDLGAALAELGEGGARR
jgi:hypothetical protein